MRSGDGDIVDLSGAFGSAQGPAGQLAKKPSSPADTGASRPFLGILFRCAAAYARAYKRPDGTAYEAHCPKCGKSIEFGIGEGGTTNRNFEVSCGG